MSIDPKYLPQHVQAMLDTDKLRKRKTLHQGHTDDLKYERGPWRVWLSRMLPGDWQGARVPEGFPITVEKLIDGCWTAVYGDGAD